MAQKGNFKDRPFKNDLDSEFDLDEYLNDQGQSQKTGEQIDNNTAEERSDLIKNSLLVVAVITTIFLWIFDWSPRNAYSYFFGEESTTYVFGSDAQAVAPNVEQTVVAEAPRFPEFEPAVEPSQNSSAVDYIVELREKGLLDQGNLSGFAARQLYSSGVPVSYIEALAEANFLDDFSFVDISEFYSNRVPIEYLQALDQAGFLNDLSFVDITEFYSNNVSFDYLNQLDQLGILDDLSFVDITEFYSSNVSIDYLRALEENDYIGKLSFVDITEFYENGVTIEFLNELKSKGLIDDLSFVDIVDLYKAEGN